MLFFLGPRPDVCQFALLINYCFLIARYDIWLIKSKEKYPNLKQFACLLKSQYEIETKKGDTKKWKPLAGYINVRLISFIQLYFSLFNCPHLLTRPYLNSSRVFHMPLFLILFQQYKQYIAGFLIFSFSFLCPYL